MITVAPSILACDFARLADEARRAEDAGADQLHVDVMDGHYVRNLTFGPLVVEAVRRSTRLPLNVHLMIDRPDVYAGDFVEAGADYVLVHPESPGDPMKALRTVRDKGVKTGIALNPETPVESALDFLPAIDFLLLMSVNPGWGGQAFMPEVLPKFEHARPLCRKDVEFGIDGGIDFANGRKAVQAGADYLVAGTFLFRSDDMAGRIEKLKRIEEEI